MAKASKIGVTYERKVNLGNYQSATIGVSVWVDVEDGDVRDCIDYGQALCREKAENEIRRLYAPDPTNTSITIHNGGR